MSKKVSGGSENRISYECWETHRFGKMKLAEEAYLAGKNLGYNLGYNQGFESGYERGFAEGSNLGYNNGFVAALRGEGDGVLPSGETPEAQVLESLRKLIRDGHVAIYLTGSSAKDAEELLKRLNIEVADKYYR